MNKKILGIFLFAAFMVSSVWAQGRKGLRINEVLVTNENNYQDDYGCQSAWIEIFNTTFGTVDVRSCYLTNDKNNPKKYPIPKGDVLTEMPPRQHVLFWADGKPNRGTFHVNFTLDPDKDNWIGLYDSNGRDLIDSVTVPAGIPTDHSYARYEDGVGHWVIKGGNEQSGYVTPSTNNITLDKNVKIDILYSMITGATYGIGTNATAPESADVRISVKGSKVTSHTDDGDNTAILFNVKGGLTIENSTIKGDRQAVIARGGDHRISNSTLIVTGENNINKEYLDDSAWGSGNEVPLSAVVVGNRSASYQYPTTINFTDVKITAPEVNKASKNYFEMYVYQNDGTNTVSASGTVKSTNTYNVNAAEAMNGASYSVTVSNETVQE